MITRGQHALSASSVFYEHLNDVDVYIEDTAPEAKKIFSLLLTKAFDNHVRIDSVFPLGGRSAVLKACQDDSGVSTRRRVYVIDGDLDHILNKPLPPYSRLYRLERYCIENYLINEESLISLIYEEDPFRDGDSIRVELNYQNWANENLPHLRRLFLAYAVVAEFDLEIKTVSRSVFSISHPTRGYLIEERVDLIINEIKNDVDARLGDGEFDTKYNLIENHCQCYEVESFKYLASGKNYVLPLLLKEARRISGSKFTNLSAIIRLSRIGEIGDLPKIRDVLGI